MDIISHGLWGSVAFGRQRRSDFWWAFFFGIMPDLISFGPYFIGVFLGIFSHPPFGQGHPPPEAIPAFVNTLYGVSHSLIIFALIFLIVWLIRRRPLFIIFAWGLHIVVDIFTHSKEFFPTPFLWPISDFTINGYPWIRPEILLPNLILLAGLYFWFFVFRRRPRNKV